MSEDEKIQLENAIIAEERRFRIFEKLASYLLIRSGLFSKTLTDRLKKVMASIIDEDQSYCIPGRSIFDNLSLVRDLLHLTEIYGLDIGLLSVDQEKAFDRVDYKYLFNTLSAFGFGEQFSSWIQILYTDVCSMLHFNKNFSCA